MEKGQKIMFKYLFILLLVSIFSIWILLRARNMQYWIWSYVQQLFSKKEDITVTKNIYVSLVDHYEPYFDNVSQEQARHLVAEWIKKYKDVSSKHTDSNGNHPKHTYFYPEEEYDEWILNEISKICHDDLGDVEIHLHHDDDTAENLKKTLTSFKQLLFDKHNLLRKDENNNIVYGFIHGNWALDNSRPDGKWCGIDNEIDILIETGCAYDMTMPSAPSDTQTSTINSIYLAAEDGKCKSHDKGESLTVGAWKKPNQLLMIQGPLTLNWKSRKLGLIPRIESSELSGDAPPNRERIDLWESCAISLKGAEEHIFIKLHTHGLQPQNMNMFFERGGLEILWSELENKYKDQEGYNLHYLTAWQMYKKIQHLATGKI